MSEREAGNPSASSAQQAGDQAFDIHSPVSQPRVSRRRMTSLTVIIVAKNEATLIADCVASARSIAGEIVVVDNGSSDDTASIASECGCRVVTISDLPLHDVRRASLELAGGNWLLLLDADERLETSLSNGIREAIETAPSDVLGFCLPRYEYVGAGRWSLSHMVRLVRRDARVTYTRSRHATLRDSIHQAGGHLFARNVPLHHLDGLVPGRPEQKRPIKIAEMQRQVESFPRLHCFLGLEYATIGNDELAEAQYQEGIRTSRICNGNWEPIARLFLGDLYLRQGKIEAARAEGLAVLESGSNAWGFEHACSIVAQTHLRRLENQQALHYCQLALSQHPGSPHMMMNYAGLIVDSDPVACLRALKAAHVANPYVLEPIIYRSGSAGNTYRDQVAFLSTTPTFPVLMSRCLRNLGDALLAERWADLAITLIARSVVNGNDVMDNESSHALIRHSFKRAALQDWSQAVSR
jgi:glycosyltransferase involved in cell wall biosynthesis